MDLVIKWLCRMMVLIAFVWLLTVLVKGQTLTPALDSTQPLSRGMHAILKYRFLSSRVETSTDITTPPLKLAGLSVTINDRACPVLYVGEHEALIVIPFDLPLRRINIIPIAPRLGEHIVIRSESTDLTLSGSVYIRRSSPIFVGSKNGGPTGFFAQNFNGRGFTNGQIFYDPNGEMYMYFALLAQGSIEQSLTARRAQTKLRICGSLTCRDNKELVISQSEILAGYQHIAWSLSPVEFSELGGEVLTLSLVVDGYTSPETQLVFRRISR